MNTWPFANPPSLPPEHQPFALSHLPTLAPWPLGLDESSWWGLSPLSQDIEPRPWAPPVSC